MRSKTPGNVDELLCDLDLQDVPVLNLSRAAMRPYRSLCPQRTKAATSRNDGQVLRPTGLRRLSGRRAGPAPEKSVGFRNLAVHNYNAINWVRLYDRNQAPIELRSFRENGDSEMPV